MWTRLASAVVAMVVGACGGAAPPAAEARWWSTCGDPACSGYGGPFDGVPLCSDEADGDPCDAEGEECDPEDGCNALLVCAVDDPKADPGGCPISLAAYKTGIRYLDDAALRAAADEALGLRLATWRYRSEAVGTRPHLGFVIDDRPASPAVATDGRKVDLYGYASLALAAVQVQQAELAARRAEVDALRAACEGR
jgi:hypothetical protein